MSRIGKIARRTFLIGSAAVAGGVAFGVYTVRKPHDNPLAKDLRAGEATFNPWVKVTSEKVVLVTPHADIGQGAVSLQAMLIAEEMDLEMDQFETEFGPPDAAYYNTAFAHEGAPFMSRDESFGAEATRTVIGGLIKTLGVQGTGGSSSVPDSFDKLRRAGAIARETLKRAAAEEAGVPVDQLRTEAGKVVLPGGEAIAYTALAARAATVEPVEEVALRQPTEWRLIGKAVRRLDIVAKSTGTQTYGVDLKMDGMVHAAVRLNPRRAGVNGYDASAAKGMRGVKGIVEVTNGVAVLADNTWRAIKAANAINLDWAPAAYPAEMDDHWAAVAAAFSEEALDSEWRSDGDAAGALVAAAPIEAEYRAPYVAHQPLEPMNAIVRVTDDQVEVWTGHQMPRFLQDVVAGVTGHEAGQVVFHNQFAGGSFGHRLEFDHVKTAAEIADTMRGTPVKLTLSREEDWAQDYPRHIAMGRGRGLVKDGEVRTLSLDIAAASAVRSQFARMGQPAPGPDMQLAAGAWNAPWAIPNLRVASYAATGLAPVSSWRSVGASTNGFFMESFLDELIHAAGADPVAERLRLCDYDVARKCLEAVAEMSGWGTDLGPNRGRGVALVISFGVPVAEVVEVSATTGGIRIDKVFVAADVGRVIDPVNFENHVQGGVIWGLGHAMNSEITYSDGMPEQANYYDAEGMRLHQTPEIHVRGLENGPSVKGIGEPPVPPAAPALANAIFAATGTRLREMPFGKFIDFA